jgi:anti-sigma factor ChrR (cupin superfamily)
MIDCAELTAPQIFNNLLATVSEDKLKWEPLREGIEISRIYSNAAGAALAFIRFRPGAVLSRHAHPGYEHIFILQGTQQDDSGDHPAGALLIHPPGTSHRVTSRTGCIVLAYWERPVEFF